jgi:bifunctional non-homologous end joining protein LigD
MAPMLWRLRSFPDFCEPCLPSQVERPPTGRDWIHEIKHDGFRLLARRGAERVRLFTRKGHDWTERFQLIVEALKALKAITCLIDGEAIACSDSGLAEFDGLRGRCGDVHLCAFDLLELDGRDLRLEPLVERRRLLAKLIRKPRSGLVVNAQFEQDGRLVFEHAGHTNHLAAGRASDRGQPAPAHGIGHRPWSRYRTTLAWIMHEYEIYVTAVAHSERFT